MSDKQINAWNKKIAKAFNGRTIIDAKMDKNETGALFSMTFDNGKTVRFNRSDDMNERHFATTIGGLSKIPLEI